ncbi:unnamed protein product [Effrenium voratum]|nr:unnamed protein product [Effrenium voratum]
MSPCGRDGLRQCMLATRQPRKRRVRARENGEVQSPYQLVQYVAYGAFDRVAEYMAKSGFNATMDYPTCLAFESFMEKYPDSKVILTVRTSGMAWANSIMNGVIDLTKGAQTKYAGLSQNLRDLRSIIFKQWQIMGLHVDVDTPIPVAEDLVPIYDKWLERVKNTVPADRLLIHQAKDGYEPLCKFLEIPPEKCPKEPYPKINSSDSLTKHKLALKVWMWFWFPVASIIFLGPFYCCYRCCCKGKKKTEPFGLLVLSPPQPRRAMKAVHLFGSRRRGTILPQESGLVLAADVALADWVQHWESLQRRASRTHQLTDPSDNRATEVFVYRQQLRQVGGLTLPRPESRSSEGPKSSHSIKDLDGVDVDIGFVQREKLRVPEPQPPDPLGPVPMLPEAILSQRWASSANSLAMSGQPLRQETSESFALSWRERTPPSHSRGTPTPPHSARGSRQRDLTVNSLASATAMIFNQPADASPDTIPLPSRSPSVTSVASASGARRPRRRLRQHAGTVNSLASADAPSIGQGVAVPRTMHLTSPPPVSPEHSDTLLSSDWQSLEIDAASDLLFELGSVSASIDASPPDAMSPRRRHMKPPSQTVMSLGSIMESVEESLESLARSTPSQKESESGSVQPRRKMRSAAPLFEVDFTKDLAVHADLLLRKHRPLDVEMLKSFE